jgi:hypothetical protein
MLELQIELTNGVCSSIASGPNGSTSSFANG